MSVKPAQSSSRREHAVALVTARSHRGQDEDIAAIVAALGALGVAAAEIAWDDPAIDWSRYALAVVRSTWDYTLRLAEFLAWAERVSAVTRLCNDLPTLRWNTDKHYLAELARTGVPTVPCQFVEPQTSAPAALAIFLERHEAAEFVVKPAISAGSRDTQRYARGDRDDALRHLARLLDAGRSAMLQPYLARVDAAGETSLLYFDGTFSHAIRKSPLLVRGKPGESARHGVERIQPRAAAADELALGERVLRALPCAVPLYARVDLLRADDGASVLIELELTEPSLFLKHGPGSVARCAAAVAARLS